MTPLKKLWAERLVAVELADGKPVYLASDIETWVKPIIACVANGIPPSVILVQDAQRLLAHWKETP